MTDNFGYRGKIGPAYWGELSPKWSVASSGKNQSPINIRCQDSVYSKDLKPLNYNWQRDNDIRVVNNGCSPTFFVTPNKHFITGGSLDDVYELVQFHIHFSNSADKGSEHAIDGTYYAAEIHFVHFKKSYGSFQVATTKCDGLAVVGAMIGVDDNATNSFMNADIMKLSEISQVGSEKNVSIDLSSYGMQTNDFYTYSGSLTTPGCSECVVWIVLKDPVWIASKAYEAMTSLQSSEGGLMSEPGNYRPVQPLYDRKVYCSFKPQGIYDNEN